MVKVVEIKNLVKSYGGKDYQTKVLKNINLEIINVYQRSDRKK